MLAQSMFADGTLVGPASLATAPAGLSTGVSDGILGASIFPTRGTTFGILSSGLAASADDPNTNDPDDPGAGDDTSTIFSGSQVRGTGDFDVTVVEIPFMTPQGANCLTMDFQFLSEEFADYVGGAYNDAFIAELDATTWDTVGASQITAPDNFAFDADGEVVSVNAVGIGGFSRANALGTTYDGATPLLRASKQLTAGAHTLYLSIFDQGDSILDSTAFVDNIRVGFVANPAQNCVPGAQVANFELALTPEISTNAIGQERTMTATLRDGDGLPVAGGPVVFTRIGPNPGTASATTGPDGVATATYTGTAVGSDAISATYDADGDGTAEASDSATALWENRFTLTASPDGVQRTRGQEHTVTAVLRNDGVADAGRTVTFTVTGANPRAASATTSGFGDAALTYTGSNLGVDTINAAFDLDGDGTAEASDEVTVEFTNTPPDCTAAAPSIRQIKGNDHTFRPVTVSGITDADGDTVTTTITTVEQDEAVNSLGDGNTAPDARRTAAANTVEVRAERAGISDGRVYVIGFTGDDGNGGTCTGSVTVTVPHDARGVDAVDSGSRYNSFAS